jgi:uncharacterized protein
MAPGRDDGAAGVCKLQREATSFARDGRDAPVHNPGIMPALRSCGNLAMWYVIIGRDGKDALPRRLQARPEHLAALNGLRDQGRLMLAGPLPAIDAEDPGPAGFHGSLIVAEFDSIEDARAWAEQDPYRTSGVFDTVEVMPFRRVLP